MTEGSTVTMRLDDIPDKVLADMVRNGCYAHNACMGQALYDARFLLVFAVPYGPWEGVNYIQEAFEAFHEFLSADDWEERNIQVLEVTEDGRVTVAETSMEVLRCN